MHFKPTRLSSNGNNEDHIVSDAPIEPTPLYTRIPRNYYPLPVILFWGITSLLFVVNSLRSCTFKAPHHIRALKKISSIKAFMANKEYFNALEMHKELCLAYPFNYANNYYINIATTCFECSHQNHSNFKDGLYVLRGKKLEKEAFSNLFKTVPQPLKQSFLEVFDVYTQERHNKKEYKFVVNDNRIKLL